MFNKIGIVIPCYWSSDRLIELTQRCVGTLQDTTGDNPQCDVLLVDDGSPLPYPDSQTPIYTRVDNGGYAAAVNSGLHELSNPQHGYDVFIVCNNDIEFIQSDWLAQLLAPLGNGYDISSIRTTDADGWETEDRLEDNAKFGSLWAIRREVYETLGGLDLSFGRGYFEDLDYWHRAIAAGFKITKNHNGIVEHVGQATFSTLDHSKIYNQAMLNYKLKHDDAILFTQQQADGVAIVLADAYDVMNKDSSTLPRISVVEAKRLWGYED